MRHILAVLCDGLHLAEDALLAATGNLLALMGADGAEGAAAETPPVGVDAPAYHIESGNGPTLLVLGMRQAQVWQIEAGVDLIGGHGRLGRIDDNIAVAVLLDKRGGFDFIAFEFDDMIVLGFGALAF